MILILSNLVAA
ncbi:putative integral membrane family protein, partial [Chlamydia psittaci 06-1683]